MFAAEMWVGQLDGYSLNRNNYLVYFEPESDLVSVLPWDHDYAFYDASAWGYSWLSPQGRLSALCLSDSTCRAEQEDVIHELFSVVEDMDLLADLERTAALIEPYVLDDPRKEVAGSSVPTYQQSLLYWAVNRTDRISSKWGF